ncbi:site-specific DNA-methyltransferase [Candidatus Poribacteria bacterium]|nr:site-specific DNA-methyltransferase [Candidatus Poribacteria bacterium]
MLASRGIDRPVDLTFLDPPFNQGKDYHGHDDDMPDGDYWAWMTDVCSRIRQLSSDGAALYFMQREKNTEQVLRTVRESGWTYQNLVVWKKKTSAVPGTHRYGKHYQIIAFATNGARPRMFHRLRIDPPLPAGYRYERENGVFVTDVWDDIRELTSGYFAGDEAIRDDDGARAHKQQSPVQLLLLRILLSSSKPGDVVLDPFAGTGTTLVVARQLGRLGVGIELSPGNVEIVKHRLAEERAADDVTRFYNEYVHTEGLERIWGEAIRPSRRDAPELQRELFDKTGIGKTDP